jgi:hypothetical protein
MQHTTWELNLIEGMQFSSKSATWISVPKKWAYKNNKFNTFHEMLHYISEERQKEGECRNIYAYLIY